MQQSPGLPGGGPGPRGNRGHEGHRSRLPPLQPAGRGPDQQAVNVSNCCTSKLTQQI